MIGGQQINEKGDRTKCDKVSPTAKYIMWNEKGPSQIESAFGTNKITARAIFSNHFLGEHESL
jgi:hypothetical protein